MAHLTNTPAIFRSAVGLILGSTRRPRSPRHDVSTSGKQGPATARPSPGLSSLFLVRRPPTREHDISPSGEQGPAATRTSPWRSSRLLPRALSVPVATRHLASAACDSLFFVDSHDGHGARRCCAVGTEHRWQRATAAALPSVRAGRRCAWAPLHTSRAAGV